MKHYVYHPHNEVAKNLLPPLSLCLPPNLPPHVTHVHVTDAKRGGEGRECDQFDVIQGFARLGRHQRGGVGMSWQSFHLIPIESGRGCPYGCEFCTVTGFFGDSIRFRSNESVIHELLMLKSLEKQQKGKIAVFFIDDNFAINPRRTKSLLQEIIA